MQHYGSVNFDSHTAYAMSEHLITPRKSRWESFRDWCKSWSPQVKQGVIGGAILVALTVAGWLSHRTKGSSKVNVPSTNIEGSVMVGNQSSNAVTVDNSKRFAQTSFSGPIQSQINASNVTQNFNTIISAVPDTHFLREWVTNIQSKLDVATNDIQLTRKDLLNLIAALDELNDRTMGIQRLPDGRTSIGGVVVGSISINKKDLSDAFRSFNSGDFATALRLSQRIIGAVEPNTPGISISTFSLNPEAKREIYALAARSAQRLGSNYLANEFASKSIRQKPTPETKMLFVTTLHNLASDYVRSNDFSNALKLNQKAIQTYEGVEVSISTNFLRRQDAMKVYAGALQNASRLGRTNEANEYFEKGQKIFREISDSH